MTAADEDPAQHGKGLWVGLTLGLPAVAYGIRGFLSTYPDLQRRLALAKWIVGVDLVHDFLVAPLAIVVGLALRCLVPARVRAPAQFGAFASAIVLALAWRPLTHSAAYKHNATAQPLDYVSATLIVLGVVWAIAAMWIAVRLKVARRLLARGAESDRGFRSFGRGPPRPR